MAVVAVVNRKGGVGKTTTAVNVAAALALPGQRTLLVDLDPQGSAGRALSVSVDDGRGSSALFAAKGSLTVVYPAHAALFRLGVLPADPSCRRRGGAARRHAPRGRGSARPRPPARPLGGRGARHAARARRTDDAALRAADGVLVPVAADFLALDALRATLAAVRARPRKPARRSTRRSRSCRRSSIAGRPRWPPRRCCGAVRRPGLSVGMPRSARFDTAALAGVPVALAAPRRRRPRSLRRGGRGARGAPRRPPRSAPRPATAAVKEFVRADMREALQDSGGRPRAARRGTGRRLERLRRARARARARDRSGGRPSSRGRPRPAGTAPARPPVPTTRRRPHRLLRAELVDARARASSARAAGLALAARAAQQLDLAGEQRQQRVGLLAGVDARSSARNTGSRSRADTASVTAKRRRVAAERERVDEVDVDRLAGGVRSRACPARARGRSRRDRRCRSGAAAPRHRGSAPTRCASFRRWPGSCAPSAARTPAGACRRAPSSAGGPSARSGPPPAPASCRGYGAARYGSSGFTASAFQSSTPDTSTSRSPANSPSCSQAAATARGSVLSASWSSSLPPAATTRERRRATARSTFGRSVPQIRSTGSSASLTPSSVAAGHVRAPTIPRPSSPSTEGSSCPHRSPSSPPPGRGSAPASPAASPPPDIAWR